MGQEAFWYGLAASALVALIYGVFFAQREAKIRGYLSSKRQGWRRARMVTACVQAVRGYAGLHDTIMIGGLVCCVPLVLAFYTQGRVADIADTLRAADNSTSQSLLVLEQSDSVASQALRVMEQGSADTEESEESREAEIRRRVAELRQRDADIRQGMTNIETLRSELERYFLGMRVISVATMVVVVLASYFWLPLLALRRHLTAEIDRFTLRIQGLASKAELANLAVAESAVNDEESLRAFIGIATAVAARHEIPQLAARFDLWAESKDRIEAAE